MNENDEIGKLGCTAGEWGGGQGWASGWGHTRGSAMAHGWVSAWWVPSGVLSVYLKGVKLSGTDGPSRKCTLAGEPGCPSNTELFIQKLGPDSSLAQCYQQPQ